MNEVSVRPEGGALAHLAERLKSLPTEPGVYLMKDRAGTVFYVGKAVNLRARVRSYFHAGGDTREFVGLLDQLLDQIEVVVVPTEHEALLLENSLIKQHHPRFNIRLRDDKTYLSLRLDLRGPDAARAGREVEPPRLFPRLEVTRKVRRDGARYFGPYTSGLAVRQTLRLINRHFGLRTCTDRTMAARRRPCIMHQMGRCAGPCATAVDPALYRRQLDDVVLFLTGRHDELLALLRQRMQEASASLAYEAAARLRDQIFAVDKVVASQKVQEGRLVDRDLIGYARQGHLTQVVVLPIRSGMLRAPAGHGFRDLVVPDDEILSSFLVQFYETVADAELPDEVLLPSSLPHAAALGRWLSERRREAPGRRAVVRVRVPRRGEAARQLQIAQRNAQDALAEAARSLDTRSAALERLRQLVGMERTPRRIECFDVSTIQGAAPVAAKVRFVDGRPDKAGYRRYGIKSVAQQDDFAMLYEALCRRLRRGLEEGDLPDLLLVDGGKGQLSVAQAACRDLGVQLALAGIAKSRVQPDASTSAPVARSDERLFLPGRKDPVALRPHTAERALVERIRDEAHRFAITFHRSRRAKGTVRSALDTVPGVGPKLRGRLLRRFGSVGALRQAGVDEVTQVPGVSRALAERLLAQLNARHD